MCGTIRSQRRVRREGPKVDDGVRAVQRRRFLHLGLRQRRNQTQGDKYRDEIARRTPGVAPANHPVPRFAFLPRARSKRAVHASPCASLQATKPVGHTRLGRAFASASIPVPSSIRSQCRSPAQSRIPVPPPDSRRCSEVSPSRRVKSVTPSDARRRMTRNRPSAAPLRGRGA